MVKVTPKKLAKIIKDRFNHQSFKPLLIKKIEIVGGRFLVIQLMDGTIFDVAVEERI